MDCWKNLNKKQKKNRPVPTWLLGTATGIVLLVLGAYYEQFADIFRKAVMICLECIGIG